MTDLIQTRKRAEKMIEFQNKCSHPKIIETPFRCADGSIVNVHYCKICGKGIYDD